MKKIIALMLALMLTLSVVTLPATAETTAVASANPEVTTEIKKIDVDNLDASINYLTNASSTSASGFTFGFSNANVSLYSDKSFGVVDITSEDKTITKHHIITTSSNKSLSIQEGYAKGENFDLIIGSALGATYPGSEANTTGRIVEGQPMKGAYLKKVADPEDATNNVLEYNFGQTGSNMPTTSYEGITQRMMFGTQTAMFDKTTATKNNSGVIAYEWKVYIPENSAKYLASGGNNYITLGGVYGKNVGGHHMLRDSTYYTGGKLMYRNYSKGDVELPKFDITTDKWHTFKYVIIVDEETMKSGGDLYGYPIVALYYDGELKYSARARNPLSDEVNCGQLRIAIAPFSKSTANQTTNFNIYYDDVKQYWIDTLSISGIENSYTDFAPSTDSVVINYTNPVDAEALKEAITVKLDNAVAEDITVNVETPDKYTAKVSFEGMNVKKATSYTVEIAEFKDQYLSTAEGKSFTVTTAPEFVATANPQVFEGFKAGTERTVEFTFSSAVSTDADKLFVVKDADGNVKTGWTATLASKNKVATVSLKDLDATGTFPYTLTVAPDVKNTAGKTIADATVVKLNKAGKYEIFSDDYTDGFVEANYKVNNKATGADKASVDVVADPAGSSNMVLKMSAQGVDTTGGFNFYLSRKPTKYNDVIDFTDPASPLYGKKLVLEMDNYTATGYNQATNGLFMAFQRVNYLGGVADSAGAYNGNYARPANTGKSFNVQNTSNSATKKEKNIYKNRLNAIGSTSVTLDKWETFRMIFDQSDITRHDTHRTYKLGENGSLAVTKAPYTYVTGIDANDKVITTTTAKAAEGANKYPEYVYDFMSERITNGTYLLFPGEENFSYDSTNTEYGKFYGLTFGWKVSTTASTRYVDNVRAYAVDPFKMVSFSSNVNEFMPEKGSTIEIGFNQTLYSDVEKLKANIMLLTKDENGEDVNVTDLISDIKVNNSKDAVAITLNPAGLVDNKEYEIAFGPEFIDEYGQALAVYQSEILVDRTRIYGDYAVKFEVLPFEGFNASVDNTTVTNFYKGANKKVVVSLTQPTALDANAISNAFEVKDNNGAAVTGWTAILSGDSKTITINLSGMDDTKAFPYTLTSLETLVNAEDESLPTPIKVTISDIEGFYPIFDETFENFKENVDWRNNVGDGNWVTSANTGVGENTWKYLNATANDQNSVMVVNETVGGRTGKFLKYTSGKEGTAPYILRNSNGNTGINFTDESSEYYGKKLVYQVDIYFGDFKPTDANRSSMLNFNSDPNSKVEGTFARFNTEGITVNAGVWENVNYLRRTNIDLRNGWHTVTAVVDQTGTNPEIDYHNVRYYVDGNPVIIPYYYTESGKAPTYYLSNEQQQETKPAPLFGTYFGNAFGGASDGKSFYLDNLKAYAIDGVAFGIEEIDFNKATGVITAKFNSILDQKFLSLVTIEDVEGNIISGATKTILADGKTLEISGILEPDFELYTAYKLKIDGLFRDIYLNEFNCYNDYEFEFVTARSGEISVANEPVANITATALTTTVEVCNRTNNPANLVMAVAVYNGYKLLGVQTVPVNLESLSDGTYNFNIAGDFTSATQVKIHFWDSIAGMNALSIPEPVKLGE